MKRKLLSVLFVSLLCQIGLAAPDSVKRTMSAVSTSMATVADVKAPSTYIYTDKIVYTPGQNVALVFTHHPGENDFPFENQYACYFLYLEDLQTGEKKYSPGFANSLSPTDMFGYTVSASTGEWGTYWVQKPGLQDSVLYGASGYLGGFLTAPSTPGTYRYVMELRDKTGTNILSQGYAPFTVVEGIEILSGEISSNRTLSNTKAYILSGMVFVQSPATLTIEPGTILFGDTGTLGGLCITQGAKINAIGTAGRPIVFTSSASVGSRHSGDWFGVAIAGKAPINVTGGTAQVEGIETVPYGGADPNDNSGILRYVRIEYAGVKFTPTREANGLYLNGVGRGTVLEYLHFHRNADDNIEFFGGTAQIKYVYCSGGEDDQLDWTEGWNGKAQFVISHVYANTGGNRGIEADNWETNNDATPRSNPAIYNMTIVGPQQNYAEAEGKADHGLMLRRGTAGKLYNFIVIGYGRDAINMKDAATIAQTNSGALVFDNAILYNNGVFGADGMGTFGNADTQTWIESKSAKVLTTVDPRLVDPYNELTPDYRPGYQSPALRIDVVRHPPDDGFFSPVEFIGGMGPDHNWLAGGWVYESHN
jgi:hypothetical protein